MHLLHGFAIYDSCGTIKFCFDWSFAGPKPDSVGTKVWSWFEDKELVKTHFSRALMGEPLPPAMLRISAEKKLGPLSAVALFMPSDIPNYPVVGTFAAFNESALSMTPREREVAKLLPSHSIKKIAGLLGVTESTINTLRARIGERVGRSGPALIALLAGLHDVL